MRIAFVSYEYPPDTGIGGIGTYVFQVATLLSHKKIHVDVICGSNTRNNKENVTEFLNVHRLKCNNREAFRELSPALLKNLHEQNPVDIIECPEFGAEGLFIKDYMPDIPLVVKLHTPSFLIKELNDHYYNKTILRKLILVFKKKYRYDDDPEYKAILKADHILSPSLSLADIVSERWNITRTEITHAPNPYIANPAFLSLSLPANTKNVLYIGRLEIRKGVQELAKAIPLVLEKDPNVTFTFLGKDSKGPLRETSMKSVILKTIGSRYMNQVRFIDHVPLDQIPLHISTASVCIFPSIWENFPNVCLEAMSAARGIIASANGGMKDMLHNVNGGILIDPFNTMAMAEEICKMVNDTQLRNTMAINSREKIKTYYTSQLLDDLQQLYQSFV